MSIEKALKKSYGQHFLHEEGVISKIVEAVDDGMTVVEIGPGAGALTDSLIKKAKRLILIEADEELIPNLFKKYPQAQIIKMDAAQVNFEMIVGKAPWVCVSNLPYNAAAAIMRQVLTSNTPPEQCVFMVQREQADRIVASVGEMSLLTLSVQLYAKVKRLFNVGPGAFTPPPKVDSTVIELRPFKGISVEETEGAIALAKYGFNHRRKKLFKMLVNAGYDTAELAKAFLELKMSHDIRPQDVPLTVWPTLYQQVNKKPA